jgi:copper ion binding protein
MNIVTKTFTVNGMACAHCKATVEKAIIKMVGVLTVEANLADKNVTVKYDEAQATPERMRNAVIAAGYDFVI